MTAMTTSTSNEGRTVTSQVIPVANVASTKSFAAAAALVEKQLLNQQSNANGAGGSSGGPPDLSRQSMAVKMRNRNRSTNDYLGKLHQFFAFFRGETIIFQKFCPKYISERR